MELKVDSGTVSLTADNTPDGVAEALIAFAQHYGDVSGSKAPNGDVLLLGIDLDVRLNNGQVQLGVSSRLGWTHKALEPAQVRHLLKVLQATLAEAEGAGAGAVH